MTYLYDGRRLVGIECRTWDNVREEYAWGSGQEESIISPEYERLPREPVVPYGPCCNIPFPIDFLGNEHLGFACSAHVVGDVQFYIDEVTHWKNYEHGEDIDYSPTDEYGDEASEEEANEIKARFERTAVICELNVQKFEQDVADYLPDGITLDNIKNRCAQLR